jgi:hypothetical protein
MDALIINKVNTVEQTVQTMYFFLDIDKGFEVFKLLALDNTNDIYYTTSFSKEYIDEEHTI